MIIDDREDGMKNSWICIIAALVLLVRCSAASAAPTLLVEDFEDGVLDPHMSIQTTGTFVSAPGIKPFTGLGGQYAFGYGRSPNRYNSFLNYVTDLIVEFPQPTPVTSISFDEMEVFDNWGSGGSLIVDGVLLGSFGRFPYNDRHADTSSRFHQFEVDKSVSTIVFHVEDITDLSEIYIDNITVSGASTVPVPAAGPLCVSGLIALFGLHRSMSPRGAQKIARTATNDVSLRR
jgi:hypothetical protein